MSVLSKADAIHMKKGDKKKKYKCNGCSATERSKNPRLAWHTSKFEGVTTKISKFASSIYHLSQGESAIRKAGVADVKADDADMLKERALKTDGILKIINLQHGRIQGVPFLP